MKVLVPFPIFWGQSAIRRVIYMLSRELLKKTSATFGQVFNQWLKGLSPPFVLSFLLCRYDIVCGKLFFVCSLPFLFFFGREEENGILSK